MAQVIGADPANGGVGGLAAVPGGQVEVSVTDIYAGPSAVEVPEADRELLELYQENGKGFTFNTMAATLRQIRDGATVINLSLGPEKPDPRFARRTNYWRLFLERMQAKYPLVVFVAAAGNEGDKNVGLDGHNYGPGGISAPNLITVGGVDNQGDRAGFSNFAAPGGEVTIAAPAVGIPVGVGMDGRHRQDGRNLLRHPHGQRHRRPAEVDQPQPRLRADQTDPHRNRVRRAPPPPKAPTPPTSSPTNVGGGLLRTDEAVLWVINDLRRNANPPQDPLDKDRPPRPGPASVGDHRPKPPRLPGDGHHRPGTHLRRHHPHHLLAGQGTIGASATVAMSSGRRHHLARQHPPRQAIPPKYVSAAPTATPAATSPPRSP